MQRLANKWRLHRFPLPDGMSDKGKEDLAKDVAHYLDEPTISVPLPKAF